MLITSILSRAMRLLGLIDSGEAPAVAEVDSALEAYNGLMGFWSNRGWLVPQMNVATYVSLTPASAFSMGPLGDLVVVSLVDITSVSVSIGGVKANIPQGSLIEVESVPAEFTSTWPRFYYFSPEGIAGTLRFSERLPVGAVITLYYRGGFSSAPSAALLFPLPDRYIDAITFAVAVRIAAEYNITPSVVVAAQAQEALDAIRELNQQNRVYRSRVDPSLSAIGGRTKRGFGGIRGGGW